ncbi:BamA/TamA family outer membrane protein [Pontibacter qinzhouensis]|uniref:BamA/TamA family outer membrane protein n=1 Tax=Pontibacter qinzhouensis TaxID=2603253 RepID=A0A5C8JGU9_9BACT|nr:BamA/TamA family outer membrane protein [Pontibacter qinzhouensis]TXK36632.1 BamA/TamA family outer membrane protein [Pontibacter qinzhouensis]
MPLFRLRFVLLLFTGLAVSLATQAGTCDNSYFIVSEVDFEGNETTREKVLLLELDFIPGDTIVSEQVEARLEENRRRLLNLRLFHEVGFRYDCEGGQLAVVFFMQERWYLYPVLIFDFADRNFNAWLEKKDLKRLDYGITLTRRNFRGRNEDVRLRLQHGFNRRLELSYRVPYISHRLKLGLDLGLAHYRSRTINIANAYNRQRFLLQEDVYPIQRSALSVGLVHRQSVQRQETFRFSLHQEQISDSALSRNPDYFRNQLRERQYARFELAKVVNLRNNFSYPSSGRYFDASVTQAVFFQNSGAPVTTVRAKFAEYFQLSDKYFYAAAAEGQMRLSEHYAFADNVALGFRSLVRGYELFVVGGQHYGLLKQGLSRELVNISGFRIKQLKSAKFNRIPLAVYLNAFADAGYVNDDIYYESNQFTNKFLLGGGLGLHVVTFYDMVLRMEYTLNREGNKGLYVTTGFPF